jgi:hypothetical protein
VGSWNVVWDKRLRESRSRGLVSVAADDFEAVAKPSSSGLTMSSVLTGDLVMVKYGKKEASQGGEEEE